MIPSRFIFLKSEHITRTLNCLFSLNENKICTLLSPSTFKLFDYSSLLTLSWCLVFCLVRVGVQCSDACSDSHRGHTSSDLRGLTLATLSLSRLAAAPHCTAGLHCPPGLQCACVSQPGPQRLGLATGPGEGGCCL